MSSVLDFINSGATGTVDSVVNSFKIEAAAEATPAPVSEPEVVDAPEAEVEAPVEDVKAPESLDDLLEALTKDDTPKEPTVDEEWSELAGKLKADKERVQKEAISALKKLTDPDVAARKAALADLAKTVGIDLSGDSLPTSDADKAQIDALRAEVAALKGQKVAEAKAKAEAEIKAFAEKHEDLDKFRPEMAKLLKAGIATDVKDAYRKAKALAGAAQTNIKHVKPSGAVKPATPKKDSLFEGGASSLHDLRESFAKALKSN